MIDMGKIYGSPRSRRDTRKENNLHDVSVHTILCDVIARKDVAGKYYVRPVPQ
jgi:hypothetical protein